MSTGANMGKQYTHVQPSGSLLQSACALQEESGHSDENTSSIKEAKRLLPALP